MTARTEELIKKDACYLHPFIEAGVKTQIVWERGKGAKLWDTEGKEYIDMLSGGWCVNLGYGRKELIDAAYEQMQQLAHILPMSPFGCIPTIEYAAELVKVLPGDINHVSFTSGGTESTEIAVRLARMYWSLKGQAARYKVISLFNSYHGFSHLAISLTGNPDYRGITGFEFPGVVRVPVYHCYNCSFGLKYPSCNMACAHYVERVIEIETPGTICCMIGEPVGGNMGIIWPPDEYWPIVSKILKEHEIPLIADEVQCGFCRTGKFWGMDNYNVVPDIMTMAKGITSVYIPFGAVGISDTIYKTLEEGKIFIPGATAHGHAAGAAVARAALKIYIEEKMEQRVAKLGEHLHERLVKEFLPLPCIDDLMGRGLYQGIEIALNKTTGSKYNPEAQKKASKEVFRKCIDKGVLLNIAHDRRVFIVPPFIIGEDELDAALDVMLSVMKEVKPV